MNNVEIKNINNTRNKIIKMLTKKLKKSLDVVFQYETTVYWIYWSECNNGWIIDIFENCNENTTVDELADIEDYDYILCSGKAKQAVKWALFG